MKLSAGFLLARWLPMGRSRRSSAGARPGWSVTPWRPFQRAPGFLGSGLLITRAKSAPAQEGMGICVSGAFFKKKGSALTGRGGSTSRRSVGPGLNYPPAGPRIMMPLRIIETGPGIRFRYEFLFLKGTPGNPSRPPFSKGRRAFLNAFDRAFPSLPLWGRRGILRLFKRLKGYEILHRGQSFSLKGS